MVSLVCGWKPQNKPFVQKGLYSLFEVRTLQGVLSAEQVCEQGKVLTGSLYGSDHRMG